MNLLDIVRRQATPKPWAEGDKIPWHDPDFSRRMLRVHLSQDYDAASRRIYIIDKHIAWIHATLLAGQPSRILDLGCGPGLYASRLARLGHTCTGIDFSPASIAHARQEAEASKLSCTYIQDDVRLAEYGAGHDLAVSIFGEFNVFRPTDARLILRKAHHALADGGCMLIEASTFAHVQKIGGQPPSWYAAESGLFSDQPHLCLEERFWDDEQRVAIERFFVIDAATGQVTRHAASNQAYMPQEYQELLITAGFKSIEFAAWPGVGQEESWGEFHIIVARK